MRVRLKGKLNLEKYRRMVMNMEYDDNDRAVNIAWKKFEEIHPEEMRPKWLEKYMVISGTQNQNKNWVIKITLLFKMQLKSNQHWEWVNNHLRLVETDEITGKPSIVICGGPPAGSELLFEVEIDFAKDLVKVVADRELNTLEQTKYELLRR